jgi:DNA gyrase subunit A
VKKTKLSEFASVRRSGLIAMDLEPNDVLVSAKLAHEDDEVVVVTSDGKGLRYSVQKIPSRSRAAGGVRAIKLGKGARIVSIEIVAPDHELLTMTQNGYGKRTPFSEYNPHGRATAGQLTYQITAKTGPVTMARTVNRSQELIVISQQGIVLRTTIESIRITGRSAQGVSIIGLAPGDSVAAVAIIDMAQPQGAATAEGPEPGEPAGDAGAKQMPLAFRKARANKKTHSGKAQPAPKAAKTAPPKPKAKSTPKPAAAKFTPKPRASKATPKARPKPKSSPRSGNGRARR